MEIIVLWLFLSLIAGYIAANKGRSGAGFFLLSLFLSPLIGIIVALVISSNDNRQQHKCPFCAESVKSEAIVCPHCGADISASSRLSKGDLKTSDDEINQLNKQGSTQLMMASSKGNIDEIIELLNQGADPRVTDRNGMTAKDRARNTGQKKAVKLLDEAENNLKSGP